MSEVIGIGAAPRRKEDLRFLTGRGNYVADIQRPAMVAGVFARSPHAHAEIKSIDTGAARAMPGVLAVFTGGDLKANGVNGLPCGWGIKGRDGQPMKEPPHPAMAQDKVRYVGDAVACVVAESVQQARNAAEAVAVDYHVLPPVTGLTDALKPETALVYDDVPNNLCCHWDLGDKAATDAAFKRAAHIARVKLANNRLVGNPMEPRAAVAEFHPETGHYTLWSTSQFPHVVRLLMGLFVLNIPQQKLRVIAPDVGGGFGVKQFHYAEEAVVTWACRKVGRPIKWVCERSEGFISDAHGRDHVTEAELGLDADGKFLGLRVKTIANLGGYISTFGPNIPTNLYGPLLAGVYTTPAIYCEVKVVFTNTVPVDAYRGAGRPEATFVLERLVDIAATQMGIDRVEIRRRNMIPKEAYLPNTRDDAVRQRGPERMSCEGHGRRGLGRLPRPQGAISAAGQAARHRDEHLRGSLWACPLPYCRPTWRPRWPLRKRDRSRPPDWPGHCTNRNAQSRPRSRDDIRPDRRRKAWRAIRKHRHRLWGYRQGAIRHGHLWVALARRRRARAGEGLG